MKGCFHNLFYARGLETRQLLKGGMVEKRLRTTALGWAQKHMSCFFTWLLRWKISP